MEFEDAVKLLKLAAPLFELRTKVYHDESGDTFEVDSIAIINSPKGVPELHIKIWSW